MEESGAYTTMKKVVYAYSDEAQKSGAAFRRLFGIASRGVIDLSLDVIGVPTTRRRCVDANKTAQLPSDYMKWTKVGILNSKGQIATLKHNPSLTTYAASDPNRLSMNTDGSVNVDDGRLTDLFYLNFIDSDWGYYGSNLFGVSGNEMTKIGDFKVDTECGVILLDNTFPYDYVMLEYLAVPDEDAKIPIESQEALIAWIAWRDIAQLAASRKVSIYDKRERKREYYHQKELARIRIKPFILQDAVDASQDAIRLVPKG